MRTNVSPDGQLRFAFTSAEQRRLREAVMLVGGVAGAIRDDALAAAADTIRERLMADGVWLAVKDVAATETNEPEPPDA